MRKLIVSVPLPLCSVTSLPGSGEEVVCGWTESPAQPQQSAETLRVSKVAGGMATLVTHRQHRKPHSKFAACAWLPRGFLPGPVAPSRTSPCGVNELPLPQ